MRKKILMVVAAMMATISVSAQSRFEAGTFTVQPFLGGTGARLSNTPDISPSETGLDKKIDATFTGGSIIGAEVEYRFTDRLSLAAGVNYAQAGSGWEDTKISDHGITAELKDFKVETSYLNVPLTLNYYLFKGFAVKAGAQFGFLMSADVKAKLSYSGEGRSTSTKFDESVKDEFNKFDFSIPVGISYEFKVPICIDVRYNIGITKVNKESEPGYEDSRNQMASITIGYKFGL